ncbi:NRDE family protein [Luteimonas sp. A277]
MCLIALAWKVHPRYPLALIANRDELHARPTAPAGFDPEAPHVYGGRDLVAGGGWLQASTRGRLAAVTNVRNGLSQEQAPRSRGALVRDFVRGNDGAMEAARVVESRAAEFGPFNLLLWDSRDLAFASNQSQAQHAPVTPGVHAMSNGAFDAPWPKSNLATRALESWIESLPDSETTTNDPPDINPLFAALADRAIAPDHALPDTGVGIDLERRLSPPFVVDDEYGTRCSSVVLVGGNGILFAERSFGPGGAPTGHSSTTLTNRSRR